ncbi:sporulation protein YjcZ [Paenibacillus sp. KN14-4R]
MGEIGGLGRFGFGTSTSSILVLFILLVIISCTICGGF